ncbi:MAG: hypothetical protein ACHQ2Z_10245 [Elusimicrobiota bacterium]
MNASPVRLIKPASIAWDVRSEAPSLLRAVEDRASWVRPLMARFRRRMPIARTCGTFRGEPYLRPDGHHRAFYIEGRGPGALGVKGSELLADDLPAKLAALSRPPAVLKPSPLEYFPIIEQKIPMAMTLEEGLAQARKAAAFQAAHLARYGELARIPVPLLVFRWDSRDASAFLKRLRPALSKRAGRIVERLASGGLSSMIYYYPSVPLRTLHLAQVVAGAEPRGYRDGVKKMRRYGSFFGELEPPSEIASRWIALTARMLALGFFPSDLSHWRDGQMLHEQNAVLDGGFVDVESLQPQSEVTDDRTFYETFLMSWLDLSATVKRLMTGYADRADVSWPFLDLSPAYLAVPALVGCHVGARLRDRLREEALLGAPVDPRLFKALGADGGIGGLESVLEALFDEAPERKARA